MRSTFLCVFALLLSSCGLAMSNEDRLDRAEAALAAQDARAAIIDAKDVLRDEPDNLRGRILLGRASVAIGDGVSAEKEFRRAIELGVSREDVLVPLARGLLQQGKFKEVVDEISADDAASSEDAVELKLIRGDAFMGLGQSVLARELYNDVLAASPDSIGAHLGIASSYRAENNVAEARRVLDHVIGLFAEDVRGWLASAQLYLRQGNFELAASSYEKAAGIATNNDDISAQIVALAGLAESRLGLGEIDHAREAISSVSEIAPDSLQSLFLISRVAYIDEDWATAQKNLQRILQRAPEYLPAQTLLGAVHLRNGKLSQAEMYLSAVVAAAPDYIQARRLLAETRLRQQDANEAEATLAPLVSSDNPDPVDLAMAARVSFGKGDTDTAIDWLRLGVKQDPGNTELKLQLAMALMNAGRQEEFAEVFESIDATASPQNEFRRDLLGAMSAARTGGLDEALLVAERLTSNWPKNSTAQNFLGSVHAARGDLISARGSFERSLELQTGNVIALRSLALIDEQEDAFEAAMSRYSIVLEMQPDATWAMYDLGRLAARTGDLESSQEWLQRIRSLDRSAVQARATLAAIMLAQGDFVAAEEVLDEAIDVDPRIAELHNLLGRARAGKRDHASASEAFKRALELAPDNERYRVSLANSQRLAGNAGLAERTLSETGSINLDHIPAGVTAAAIKVEAGDLGGAMQIAKALQERHPSSPVPIALEAEIHVRSEKLEDANAAYDRALAIDVMRSHVVRAHEIKSELGRGDKLEPINEWLSREPFDSDIRMLLAESLMEDGHLNDSIGEYEKVIKQDPNNGVALNNLAWSYYLADDVRAAETARKAYTAMPNNGSVVDTLGWILVETGDADEGVEFLRRAVDLSNGRAEVRYHYAVGLAKTGYVDDARRILQDILSNDESFSSRSDAERLLSEL